MDHELSVVRLTDQIDRLERELGSLRRERDSLRADVRRLHAKLEEAEAALSVVSRAGSGSPPSWLTAAKSTKVPTATLVALLSDTHFDEVVTAAEVNGLNCYDRRIATARLRRWATKVVELADTLGFRFDGLVLMLGGDLVSGDIHAELTETNADTILSGLLYWSEQLAAAVRMLADRFGRVHVMSVPGNHGRTSRKPRAKLRARTNFDWLLSHMCMRMCSTLPQVTWDVPEAADAHVVIQGWHHHLTHGDQVRGGGGIGGIWPPIMRLRARKLERLRSEGADLHTLWMGHWHQYIAAPYMVVNGSLKGYDEYAAVENFPFEPPQQAIAVVTRQHNITWQAPVFVADRAKEGW